MSKPTKRSQDPVLSNSSHHPFQDAKAIEFEESSSLAYTPYDRIQGPEASKVKIHHVHHHIDSLHLPCKSFASASRSTRQRFSHQATVAFFLSIWCGCLLGFTFHWPYRNDPRYKSLCPLNGPPSVFDIFTPTTVYGSFTLGQAKAIDVAWNMVVGRAAQAFISFVFYSVLMDISMRMMEMTTMPIDLFTSLVFNPFHFTSKVRIVKSLGRIKGWRIKTAMIWIFFSTVYIASIPAINDAMTGYIPRYTTNVTINGTITALNDHTDNPRADPIDILDSLDDPHISCELEKNYAWGFATFWVLLSALLCTIWIIGTYAIWLDAQHHSELVRKGRKMGMNRAIVDVAESITEALGPEINAYSEAELEKALKKHPGVMFSVEERVEKGTERIRLSYKRDGRLQLSWMKKYGA
ncbi:hypothetical protein EG327_006110 [Venturia inaequalis]|uniref:Uncharacterized protein n=1 Tax=Venturia inaequalis TaxID=5025 RepID=A0A8H3V7B5_VENIN|nr:hypothetical protein EG327_006110 [Venturia inaequalis]